MDEEEADALLADYCPECLEVPEDQVIEEADAIDALVAWKEQQKNVQIAKLSRGFVKNDLSPPPDMIKLKK